MARREQRPHDGRRHLRRIAVAFVVVLLVGLGSQVASASAARKATIATVPFATPTGVTLSQAPPPWPLPADARPYIAAAGLSVDPTESLQVHYHAHVDIIANGAAVTVPA